MKTLRMREKLNLYGLTLLQMGKGFTVTNNGVIDPIDLDFPNLLAVENWFKEKYPNRLTEAECDEWDDDWAEFVMKENDGMSCMNLEK